MGRVNTHNSIAEAYNHRIKQVAEEYNISEDWAVRLVYLRTRARWTSKQEAQLVKDARAGKKAIHFGEL